MHITANIKIDGNEFRVDFEDGQEAEAAGSIKTFLAALAGTVPVAEQAPTMTAKALLEAVEENNALKARIKELEHPTSEQKEASGTPRKPRGGKKFLDQENATAITTAPPAEEPAPVVTMSHEVTVEPTPAADALETSPTEATIEQAAADLYAARGYDAGGNPVLTEKASEPLATEEEQAAVLEAFAAAGMAPLAQHEYLTTVYPGVPVTVGGLKGGQARALVALLASKANDTPAAADTPPLTDDDAPPIDWNGPMPGEPVVDLDAKVTPTQAEEVREQARALKIAPGDARAILRQHFNVGTPDELTAGQARRAVDVYFPEWAANPLPF